MLQKTKYKNASSMAFNMCEMPFKSNSIDVVSSRQAIINIEAGTGNHIYALQEAYRVLRINGCLVLCEIMLTTDTISKLTIDQFKLIKEHSPSIFINLANECKNVGFKNIMETVVGAWSNENDESGLADLCRRLGVVLEFEEYLLFCEK
jgi:hypothetical protein